MGLISLVFKIQITIVITKKDCLCFIETGLNSETQGEGKKRSIPIGSIDKRQSPDAVGIGSLLE